MPPAEHPDRTATDHPPAAPDRDAGSPGTPVPAPDGWAGTVPGCPAPDDSADIDPGDPGTIRQVDPPSFLLPGSASAGSAAGSSHQHSGREVRQLDRMIARSRGEDEAVAEGYRLVGRLGIGAFGTVWAAEDEATGERVAIKFLTSTDIRWERMLDEVRLLQKMENTPGIVAVKVVRAGADGRPPYYVMPLANRGSLADRLEKSGRPNADGPALPLDEVVRLFTRVAEAMAAVHRRGILHCDLKPRNVLLHGAGDADPDEPLIADFGQAHLATDDTPALGTFFYMPPDQAAAGRTKARPDTSWDVYGLGAILYEMVVGEPPRKCPGLLTDLKNTAHLDTKLRRYEDGVRAAPAPAEHRGRVDPALAKLIDRCLDLDPHKRPRDAGEVAAALRAREWWRETRPVLMLAAAGSVLLLVFVVVLGWWVAQELTRETKQHVTHELHGNLARTAWYGKQAVEERLREHVAFVERHAKDPGRVAADARAALAAASDRVARLDHPFGPADLTADDRRPAEAWAKDLRRRLESRWGSRTPAVNVVLAAGGRAYVVTRVRPNGSPQDPAGADEDARKVFATNFAFRDYFNGTGDKPNDGAAYPPITRTHVSQVYRALTGARPWMIDVSTPVWADPADRDPAKGGRVVGVLRLGLSLEDDLLRQLTVPPDHLPQGDPAGDGRGAGARVVLVDDRDRWVWHREGMARLREAGEYGGTDSYAELSAGRPDRYPWKGRLADGKSWSGVYLDPVRSLAEGDDRPEIAHAVALDPYGPSEYKENRGREWAFVVRVDEEAAHRPVAELRRKLFAAGAVVFVALAAVVAGLWVWLVRVLRGRGFASHG